jgi:uroporphyrin-III C-methyltransferase
MKMSSNLNSHLPTVFFIGAGPGDRELLTLKAHRLLANAFMVLYDALIPSDILDFCGQAVCIPVGKRSSLSGGCSLKQGEISELLVNAALSCPVGKYVVRLKGGDPSLFGRLDEELRALEKEKISFEMVPGISAALACAAAVKRPLTQRHKKVEKNARSVAFVTFSHAQDGDEYTRVPEADTLVVYMVGQDHTKLYDRLIHQPSGRWKDSTPIAWVAGASTREEKIYLGQLIDLITPPESLLQFFNEAHQTKSAMSLLVGEVLTVE